MKLAPSLRTLGRPVVLGALAATAALAAACTAAPVVERRQAALGDVNLEGLECRRVDQTGSLRDQTICASPERWAAYDAEQRGKFEDFDRIRDNQVNDPFGRLPN